MRPFRTTEDQTEEGLVDTLMHLITRVRNVEAVIGGPQYLAHDSEGRSRSALHPDSGRSCNLNFLRYVAPMHIASWYYCQLFVLFDVAASDNGDFNGCWWIYHFRSFALDKVLLRSPFYAPALVPAKLWTGCQEQNIRSCI